MALLDPTLFHQQQNWSVSARSVLNVTMKMNVTIVGIVILYLKIVYPINWNDKNSPVAPIIIRSVIQMLSLEVTNSTPMSVFSFEAKGLLVFEELLRYS